MIEDFLPIIQKYLDAGEYQSFLGDLESFNQLNERLSTETQEINRLTAILTIDRIALDQQCDYLAGSSRKGRQSAPAG